MSGSYLTSYKFYSIHPYWNLYCWHNSHGVWRWFLKTWLSDLRFTFALIIFTHTYPNLWSSYTAIAKLRLDREITFHTFMSTSLLIYNIWYVMRYIYGTMPFHNHGLFDLMLSITGLLEILNLWSLHSHNFHEIFLSHAIHRLGSYGTSSLYSFL